MDPSADVNPDPRRSLPRVDRLAEGVCQVDPAIPEWAAAAAARDVLAAARHELGEAAENGSLAGNANAFAKRDWVSEARNAAARLAAPHPQRVVNATGVVLHTNLGRAPLAPGAARAALEASAYSSLELDLETGRRGHRLGPVGEKLRLLAGAEAAMACNNNAAAVMLALDALARGREVIVSRGELVEIGGAFRVPDILERAGVRLVEVGTTNRTHPSDYERAIGPDTALILKVHQSNFAQTGFVKEVSLSELVEIGHAAGVPVVEDLGSGTLVDLRDRGFPEESFAPARLATGVDVVCFSGDKLLGGPQAGLVVGQAGAVSAMRASPLARALRLDKMTLAALDWTLDSLLAGRAEQELPVLQRLLESPESLDRRAHALAEAVRKRVAAASAGDPAGVSVESQRAPVGGGSLPGFDLETRVVAVRGWQGGPDQLAARLRGAAVPVLARVRDDALFFDLRSLDDRDSEDLLSGLEGALA